MPPPLAAPPSTRGGPTGLAYLAFALFVLGSQWLLIAHYGSAVPLWDQ